MIVTVLFIWLPKIPSVPIAVGAVFFQATLFSFYLLQKEFIF